MWIVAHLANRASIPLLDKLSAANRRRLGYLLELSSMRLVSKDQTILMQSAARKLREALESEIGPHDTWPKIFLNQSDVGLRIRGENDDLAKRWAMADSLSMDRMKSEMPAVFRK